MECNYANNEEFGHKTTTKLHQDNGSGMPHKDIPNMLGKVLSGTKYGVKQTRGKFGLGAKMALIWSKMTTGLPFEIYSARQGQTTRSHYILVGDGQQLLLSLRSSCNGPSIGMYSFYFYAL